MWSTLLLAMGVIVGCGGGKAPNRMEEFRALLDAGRYEDALAQVEVYRSAGEKGPVLDYAEGVALLSQNADKIAIPLLQRAVGADSTLASECGGLLADLARSDWQKEWKVRAALRMKQAYIFDPTVDLGDLKDAVGDRFYRYDEDYDHAYGVYRQLHDETDGSTAKRKEWVYRYAVCLEKTGSPEAARLVYEEYRERWPNDRHHMRRVNWRYIKLLIGLGQKAEEHGQDEEALGWYEKGLSVGWHADLQQELHYRAGRVEQNRGNLEAARDHYEEVVNNGSEFGGRYVEMARTQLDELHEMGVH